MKNIISIIFVLLLNIPTLISLDHFFDSYHQELCLESKEHLHEKEVDCVSCDFLRNFQDISFENSYFNFESPQYFSTYFFSINLIFTSKYFLSYFSRGPPSK
ncbi:MAG: hypothetical protein ACKVJ4_06650 [Flavobacteriales bacterium]